MTEKNEVKFCPLCQQENLCAVADNEGCWCMSEPIPKALIAQVSNESKGKSCICYACVQKFNQAQEVK